MYSITEYYLMFRKERKLKHIVAAIWLVFEQGRLLELFFSYWCEIRYFIRSRNVLNCLDEKRVIKNYFNGYKDIYSKNDLIERFGEDFFVSLPEDFFCSLRSSVVVADDFVVIGEYGNHKNYGLSRIYVLSKNGCVKNDLYLSDRRVKHIHSICLMPDKKSLWICVGDSAKYLDLWQYKDGNIIFNKRIKRRFAGYTSVVEHNGKIYCGSDFSSRMNFIDIYCGSKRKRVIYPEKAVKYYCTSLSVCDDRYIYSLSNGMGKYEGYKVLSVFDMIKERFVYCDYCDI